MNHDDKADDAETRKAMFRLHAQKHLRAIAKMLTDEACLTLVARFPSRSDQTLIVTDDPSITETIAAMRELADKRRERDS